MLDLLFFLLIAVTVFIKLFKTFGQIDGDDIKSTEFSNIFEELNRNKEKAADIDIISAAEAALPQKIRDVFDFIRKKEVEFNAEVFVAGAKKAFIMILNALTRNDKSELEFLLSSDVYKVFAREIDNRIASNYIYSRAIVGIKEIEILDASIEGNFASITLKIISDQISYVQDKAGNLFHGNPDKIVVAEDTWQFGKSIGMDKVWLLLSTSA